jgi:ESF2/ABP1 family protein
MEEGLHKSLNSLSPKKLARFNEENARKGVCYLGRMPPFLKPAKLRHLLSGFGTDVLRIYLAPEDKSLRARRLRAGGNKKQLYGEGWVEFADKGIAKRIASSLNNTAIGGSKRSFYAYDLWNIKYLSKFKWDDLTEKIAYERKVREQKLRLELAQAKRENAFYVQKVNQSKAFEAMEERKRPRSAAKPGAVPEPSEPVLATTGDKGVRRTFAQKPVLRAPTALDATAVGADVLSRVLHKGKKPRLHNEQD